MHIKSTYFWKITILSIICFCLQFSQIKITHGMYVHQNHYISDSDTINHLYHNQQNSSINNHCAKYLCSHVCCHTFGIFLSIYDAIKTETIFKGIKFYFTKNLYKFLSAHLIYKPNWS